MSTAESSQDFLLTRYGARLYRIDHAEFQSYSEYALKHTELQVDDVIYTANATSPLLEQYDTALTFDATIEEMGAPYTPFALASFTLSLLNPDLKQTSFHRAEIDSAGNWFIINSEAPIAVRSQRRRRIITEVRKGYLLQHADDSLDTELQNLIAKGVPLKSPPLS